MPTDKRIERITQVLDNRQRDLRVVLEGLTIAHNASAVIRTCDAAGILYLDLISPNPDLLPFNRAISTRADKWVEVSVHRTPGECLPRLKEMGFEIVATALRDGAEIYSDVDFTKPTALVFGSEADGLSDEVLIYADKVIRIPMLGMVQSLNLSVSVGITLYEALRQRRLRDRSEGSKIDPKTYQELKDRWLKNPK